MSIYCLNCWWACAFYNISKNFVNKKFLYLSLEYTLNSAGHSANFDFFGTLSNLAAEFPFFESNVWDNIFLVRSWAKNKGILRSLIGLTSDRISSKFLSVLLFSLKSHELLAYYHNTFRLILIKSNVCYFFEYYLITNDPYMYSTIY